MIGPVLASWPDGLVDGVDPGELAAPPIIYFDGRNDNFESAPAERRHL
jgi:hypothetical protein